MKRGSQRNHLKNKPISWSAPGDYSYWPTGPCSHISHSLSLTLRWTVKHTCVSPSLQSGGSGDSPRDLHSLQKHLLRRGFQGGDWKEKDAISYTSAYLPWSPVFVVKIFENCWRWVAMSGDPWSWVLLRAVALLPHIRVTPWTYSFINRSWI